MTMLERINQDPLGVIICIMGLMLIFAGVVLYYRKDDMGIEKSRKETEKEIEKIWES